MKKVFLMLIIGVVLAFSANAQTRKSEQSKAWKKFQTAIAKNDRSAVAAMLKYPFEGSILNSGINYTLSSKADFIKNYPGIFTASRRKIIARAKYEPIPDEDEFNVEMNDEESGMHVFRFRKIGAAYFLVGTIGVG